MPIPPIDLSLIEEIPDDQFGDPSSGTPASLASGGRLLDHGLPLWDPASPVYPCRNWFENPAYLPYHQPARIQRVHAHACRYVDNPSSGFGAIPDPYGRLATFAEIAATPFFAALAGAVPKASREMLEHPAVRDVRLFAHHPADGGPTEQKPKAPAGLHALVISAYRWMLPVQIVVRGRHHQHLAFAFRLAPVTQGEGMEVEARAMVINRQFKQTHVLCPWTSDIEALAIINLAGMDIPVRL